MPNRLVRQTAVPLGNELSTHFVFLSALPAYHNAKAMPPPLATKETKIIQVLMPAAHIPRIPAIMLSPLVQVRIILA